MTVAKVVSHNKINVNKEIELLVAQNIRDL